MSFAQQTSSISEKWKAMTDEDKAPYTALLVEDQARYKVRRERERQRETERDRQREYREGQR